jgi:hypothetical protein
MAPDLESLRQRYRQEPDAALLAARALGSASYTPEGWQAIEEEVQRRGLTYAVVLPIIDAIPEPRAAPTGARSLGLAGWLDATLLLLAGILLLHHILIFVSYLALMGAEHTLPNALMPPVIFSLIAFGLTRFVHDGPFRRPSQILGNTAIAFTLVSLTLAVAKHLGP